MPSPEYQRFLESLEIGFEEWHDGIGYACEALAGLPPEERAAVETLLVARLTASGTWRDVEALEALGTPGAKEALRGAARHRCPEVRNRALEVLLRAEPQSYADLEEEVVRAVRKGALDLAQSHPTTRVRRALLDCARLADPVTRVNAAAMLLYICGKADEPFDWNQRPFFLRFSTEEKGDLLAAWHELRERTGLQPTRGRPRS